MAPTERQVDIEVGYGLEPTLTDALTSTIIHERITPKLKAGDVAGALSDGADAIMAAASGAADDTLRPTPVAADKPKPATGTEIVCFLLILLILLILLTAPAALLAWYLGRSGRRDATPAERIYADIKAKNPSRPYPGDSRNVLQPARARKADDVATGIAAATVADSFTRRSESESPSYSAPSSPSIDTGSFDAGGGSFDGGGASSDY